MGYVELPDTAPAAGGKLQVFVHVSGMWSAPLERLFNGCGSVFLGGCCWAWDSLQQGWVGCFASLWCEENAWLPVARQPGFRGSAACIL